MDSRPAGLFNTGSGACRRCHGVIRLSTVRLSDIRIYQDIRIQCLSGADSGLCSAVNWNFPVFIVNNFCLEPRDRCYRRRLPFQGGTTNKGWVECGAFEIQADRQAGRQSDRHTHRQTGTHTGRHIQKYTMSLPFWLEYARQEDREMDNRISYKQTGMERGWEADRQRDRQKDRVPDTRRDTDSQTYLCTDTIRQRYK